MSSVFRQCLSCSESNWVDEKGANANEVECPSCGKAKWRQKPQDQHVRAASVDSGWEGENQGRGRYIGQLEQAPSAKKSSFAYCRSMGELREKAKRSDMTVHKDAW
jgi:predicted RNA-binding Zn-ribbon protein involved in translation (DUF1610 family)